MTKAIRSYPVREQAEVIRRRLNSGDKGLGYWAAVDAEQWRKNQTAKKTEVKEE